MHPKPRELKYVHIGKDDRKGNTLFYTHGYFPPDRFHELRKSGVNHLVTISSISRPEVDVAANCENIEAHHIFPGAGNHIAESFQDLRKLKPRWKSGALLVHAPHIEEESGTRTRLMMYGLLRMNGATPKKAEEIALNLDEFYRGGRETLKYGMRRLERMGEGYDMWGKQESSMWGKLGRG